jgi:hypothetical protein
MAATHFVPRSVQNDSEVSANHGATANRKITCRSFCELLFLTYFEIGEPEHAIGSEFPRASTELRGLASPRRRLQRAAASARRSVGRSLVEMINEKPLQCTQASKSFALGAPFLKRDMSLRRGRFSRNARSRWIANTPS